MNNLIITFMKIRCINSKYNLPIEFIEEQIKNFERQKVTIPIIGKFSAGKTALVNTLLGYGKKLLSEDLTPETVVPTEITFSEDTEEVIVESEDGIYSISIEEYIKTEFDYSKIKSISMRLNNRFLESINDVMIVDMPGFDSGYEAHNRAIDYYLPKSLAYLVAFSAEDMALKYNMISILKELELNDMPVCIVITKTDKVTPDIIEENINKLKADLEKHIGKKEFRFCFTSSKEGEVEELTAFLEDIQDSSQHIIGKKYKEVATKLASETELFLQTLIANQSLTVSELAEKEESIKREMSELKKGLNAEAESLNKMIPNCIREIKGDLLNALNSEENSLVIMVMNGNEISERINVVVRSTVTQSIKERFVPRIQKHMENIASHINTPVSTDTTLVNKKIILDSNDIIKNVVNTAVAAIGYIIFGPVLAVIGGLISWFLGNKHKERERAAQKAQISQKLRSEVFPSVIQQVIIQLEIELTKDVEEINKLLTEELSNQYNMLALALEETERKKNIENEEKECFLVEVNSSLEELRGVKNECQ